MTTFKIPATPASQINISLSNGGGGGSGRITSVPNNISTFTNAKGKTVLAIPNSETPSLQIDGKIQWNGEDLHERLKRIETVLNIPTRDVIMEDKYSKLRRINDEYNKALAEYKTWETLKESK